MTQLPEYVEYVAKDGTKFNSLLCIVIILLLIFIGGDFALIMPAWMWAIIAIGIIAALLRSMADSD